MKTAYITFFILFIFTTSKGQSDSVAPKSPASTDKVFSFVEENPQFPGGDAALVKFLQENIHYPQMERDNDIQGKVLLRFVVDETGAVTDVTVTRSVSPGLDKEAVRVVKRLPNFIPGKQEGKLVKVYFNLPIVFKLTDPKSKYDKDFAEKINKDEFFKKAIELGEKGKYKEAAIQMKKSISHFPNDYLGYEFRGVCHVELGKNAEACNDFSRAKELGSPKAADILKKHCQ